MSAENPQENPAEYRTQDNVEEHDSASDIKHAEALKRAIMNWRSLSQAEARTQEESAEDTNLQPAVTDAILSAWGDDGGDTGKIVTRNAEADGNTPAQPGSNPGHRVTDSGPDVLLPESSKKSKTIVFPKQALQEQETALATRGDQTPWTLQQFFNGEIDLDIELSKRFPSMPMMTLIKFRTLGSKSGRRVTTLASQDGSASVTIDADAETKVIQLSFTLGSMMTLRFNLSNLSDADRARWLDLMQREQGGLAFLWGPQRWQEDYIICISRQYHANMYAFSPNNFEAGIRMTPQVAKQLLDWLEEVWQENNDDDGNGDSPLLTW